MDNAEAHKVPRVEELPSRRDALAHVSCSLNQESKFAHLEQIATGYISDPTGAR
jgi:hypothetical protein